MSQNGRVESKTTQGCLPKSCHLLNLGIENFADILNGRLWPIATIHHSQQPTFTTGGFVSESMAWVVSKPVAGICKIGLFSVTKFSEVPAYSSKLEKIFHGWIRF